MKVCPKCSESKPFTEFYKDTRTTDNHSHSCKECTKAASRKWKQENSEKRKSYSKWYYKAHKHAVDAKNKAYAQTNPEKVKTIKKKWKQSNLDKVNADTAKRRAAKLQRTPSWLTDFDHELMAWTYHCAKVATEKFGEPYHVDHIIPLQGESVCGLHVPDNLQVIPASENMSKGNSYHGEAS